MDPGPFMVYGVLGFLSVFILGCFGKETVGMSLFNSVKEFHEFVSASRTEDEKPNFSPL